MIFRTCLGSLQPNPTILSNVMAIVVKKVINLTCLDFFLDLTCHYTSHVSLNHDDIIDFTNLISCFCIYDWFKEKFRYQPRH